MTAHYTNFDIDAAKESEGASIGGLNAPALADGLCLAAAPTFAVMALLTAVLGGGSQHMLCSATQNALSGMMPMYLLMSALHAAPWLKLISGRRRPGKARNHNH